MLIRRLLASPSCSSLAAAGALAQDKVVYHFDDAATQALKGLRNIRNHLDIDPSAKITVGDARQRRRLPDGGRQGPQRQPLRRRRWRRWSRAA